MEGGGGLMLKAWGRFHFGLLQRVVVDQAYVCVFRSVIGVGAGAAER